MRKLLTENLIGFHISQVCEQAVRLAQEHNEAVCFDFNGIRVEVVPTDSPKDAHPEVIAHRRALAEGEHEKEE